jgi:tRNA pseudouridine38-40 synthase
VSHARLFRHGTFLVLDIQADGFLHHMVRNIVGTLLEIGSGEHQPEWMDYLLEVQDRNQAGITAPPDGLYFIQAYYPPEFGLPQLDLGPVWLNLPQ